jgi:hypothetical protein
MLTDIGYIWIVNKGRLANYFERNYLRWQMDHGRITQAKFAKLLHFSPGYLNHLLEGDNKSLSFHAAVYCARLLGDYEIFEILGFERPEEPEGIFPPEVEAVMLSAAARIKEGGLAWNSPEAVGILTEALSVLGAKEIFRIEESGNSK